MPPRPALQSLHARRFCLLAQPVSVRLPPRAAYTESSILHWRNCISLRDVGLFEVPLKSEDEDGLAVTLSVEWTKCRDLFHASTSAKQLPSTLLFKGRLESSTPDGTGRMLPGPKSSLSREEVPPTNVPLSPLSTLAVCGRPDLPSGSTVLAIAAHHPRRVELH